MDRLNSFTMRAPIWIFHRLVFCCWIYPFLVSSQLTFNLFAFYYIFSAHIPRYNKFDVSVYRRVYNAHFFRSFEYFIKILFSCMADALIHQTICTGFDSGSGYPFFPAYRVHGLHTMAFNASIAFTVFNFPNKHNAHTPIYVFEPAQAHYTDRWNPVER